MKRREKMAAVVGENIRLHRKALGLSIRGLADRMDVHHPNIYRLEHGLGLPSLETVARAAQALDCDIATLLDGVDEAAQ